MELTVPVPRLPYYTKPHHTLRNPSYPLLDLQPPLAIWMQDWILRGCSRNQKNLNLQMKAGALSRRYLRVAPTFLHYPQSHPCTINPRYPFQASCWMKLVTWLSRWAKHKFTFSTILTCLPRGKSHCVNGLTLIKACIRFVNVHSAVNFALNLFGDSGLSSLDNNDFHDIFM